MMGWFYPGQGFGSVGVMGIIGIFLNLVFFGLVIWLGYRLVKGMTVHNNQPGNGLEGDKALEILKTRYARGEISKEEFREMKEHLLE